MILLTLKKLTAKTVYIQLWQRRIRVSVNESGAVYDGESVLCYQPTQNAFVESFNGRFRGGCLNQHWFKSIEEARKIIEDWRQDYNEIRPHSALNYTPPARFEKRAA